VNLNTQLKYHIPFILFCLAIFIESSISSDSFPNLKFELSDKLIHLVIYFILFMTAYYSFSNQNKFKLFFDYPLITSLIFTSLFGASDEFHQYFVPGRTCDFYDWVADVIGAVLAIVILLLYKKSLSNNKNKSVNTAYDTTK
jgi:VanZ family protein